MFALFPPLANTCFIVHCRLHNCSWNVITVVLYILYVLLPYWHGPIDIWSAKGYLKCQTDFDTGDWVFELALGQAHWKTGFIWTSGPFASPRGDPFWAPRWAWLKSVFYLLALGLAQTSHVATPRFDRSWTSTWLQLKKLAAGFQKQIQIRSEIWF